MGIAAPATGAERADPAPNPSTIPSTSAADTPDLAGAAAGSTASASHPRVPPVSVEARARSKGKKEQKDHKDPATAASSSAAGSRFQCPKCPKSFSRIENLTRHQANHDEVAKFGCPVCKKRFTRSDLLNRHRRIHGNAEAAYSVQPHMVQPNVSYPEQLPLPQTPATFQDSLGQGPYQQPILAQQNSLPISEQLNLLNNPMTTQGLSNLADAALTPGMGNAAYDELQLQHPNPNSPSPWAGFMFGDAAPSNYHGSYDANISWTFAGINQESPPDVMGLEDVLNQPTQAQMPQVQQSATAAEDNEDDEADTKDWPDRPADDTVVGDRTLSIPYRLLASSWNPAVLEEARRSNATQHFRSYARPSTCLYSSSSVLILDSQYPALFNNQGYISKAETTNCSFPCAEEFWEAPTAEDWKRLVGPNASEPPTVFYLHALNSCLLSKYLKNPPPYPQLTEFGKIFLLYALHTHVFEWRQSTIMYNPTGIKGILDNLSYTIGRSLLERRKWLSDTFDTWCDAYQTPETTPAAMILLHLAYISLDVSLSDLHLMAGRSSSPHDQLFSQGNLTQWANSEDAISTIGHVYSMLNICHQCIASGFVAENSFEITVGLFTGGLVCWAYGQFRHGVSVEECMLQVSKASQALRGMNSWMMCTNFGKILNEGFKIAKNTG
ncbi:hypothetical protein F5884DRAFT_679548 [Xylogone sp. PMI_703]|nr:hypothetical protein F5884DRAFT_679548 [Xylogone sp. PMI_703]